jgi:hypothetical protein
VSRPVAAEICKVYGIAHATFAARIDRVADLFNTARYSVTLSYVLEHLRHEQHSLKGTVTIQRRENLGR